MKCRDVLQKTLAFVVSGCLLLGLSGCGGQPEPESSESPNIQEENVPYREFNAEEFLILGGNVVSGQITYIDREENETPVTLGNAILVVYEKGCFERFSNSIKEEGTWKIVKKCLEEDWFNSESKCVELDYISEVENELDNKSYDYFRLNVNDLSSLNSKFESSPDWTTGDEIYIIAEASAVSNSTTGEIGMRITYFINQFDENISPMPMHDEFWIGNWDEIGGRTHMIVAPTDVGYNVFIQGACGAADMFELRLKGECVSDSIICTGEEWNVHYPDDGGNPTETLVSRDCVGSLEKNPSGDGGYTIMYEDGDYGLQFVREGELLPDPFAGENADDGIPYVNVVSNILGQQYASWNGETSVLGSDLSQQYLNDLDDVTYYCYFNWDTQDSSASYEAYGIRNGLIVTYIECLDDFSPNVNSYLTSDFDGIAPKTITNGVFNHHIWKLDNGYFVCCAYNSRQGYLYDEIYTCAFYADKDICLLLTMN